VQLLTEQKVYSTFSFPAAKAWPAVVRSSKTTTKTTPNKDRTLLLRINASSKLR
jgi:hypothetical protein